MTRTFRTRSLVTLAVSGLALLAICSSHASASAAETFGPVDSRSFLVKPGTSIELPGADCHWNNDYLFIRGANVASAKQIDVAGVWTRVGCFPTTE